MKNDHFVAFDTTRILVVDDDPILREFAIVHLATPNVDVEVAEDGTPALERLKLGGIDIALVDLDMPGMNGFDLIRYIRADETLSHLPVVVVTGREDMVAVDKAYDVGATSFVVKPLNWRVLSHQLAYVLRTSRSEKTVRLALEAANRIDALKIQVLTVIQREQAALLAEVQPLIEAISVESATPLAFANVAAINDTISRFRTSQERLFAATRSLPTSVRPDEI